jgi:hypothetical protein
MYVKELSLFMMKLFRNKRKHLKIKNIAQKRILWTYISQVLLAKHGRELAQTRRKFQQTVEFPKAGERINKHVEEISGAINRR